VAAARVWQAVDVATTVPNDLNKLYYGDNLDVLRNNIANESVDLVYLDPPFNSARNYNLIFAKHAVTVDHDAAQIQAFGDTWVWTPETDEQYAEYVSGGGLPNQVADALTAFRTLLGENDAMAYLVNMAPRLVELHRVLKPTGSLYLHCDPTMSHYLKVLLDAIFGARFFHSEIVWKRYGAHNDSKGYGAVHDVILFYGKGASLTFNKQHMEYDEAYIAERFRFSDPDGRRWAEQNLASPNPRPNLTYPFTAKNGITYDPPPNGWKFTEERLRAMDDEDRLHYPARAGGRLRQKNYLDEAKGVPVQDVWADISAIGGTSPERLGYPTQKPVSLMERIVLSSSNPGDVVLDPFCGCGTTVDAAQKLGRRWVGIDVTYLAIDLITKRLEDRYGEEIDGTFEVAGIPRDKAAALALFSKSPFDFERWAVSLINGQPNQKQVGDKGIDGQARFPLGDPNIKGGGFGRVLISVKGGKTIGPQFVRDLLGTVQTQKAEMGVLITITDPTRGIVDAVNHAGTYTHPGSHETFPLIQVITVGDLLLGKQPRLPNTVNPYIQASRKKAEPQDGLF
jgi:DNA modification methylase